MVEEINIAAQRELAADFWFEPPPSTSDAFWPVALAVSWIAWRSETMAIHHFEQLRSKGRAYWMHQDATGLVVAPREAESMLLAELRSGAVTAFGLVKGNERRPIGRHEWIDLRLFGSAADDRLDSAVWSKDGAVRYSDLCVSSDGVKATWPRDPSSGSVPAHPVKSTHRGAFDTICAVMRAYDPEAFAAIPNKALHTVFGSNRETCRQARNAVDAERKASNNRGL